MRKRRLVLEFVFHLDVTQARDQFLQSRKWVLGVGVLHHLRSCQHQERGGRKTIESDISWAEMVCEGGSISGGKVCAAQVLRFPFPSLRCAAPMMNSISP